MRGAARISPTGLVDEGTSAAQLALGFLDSVLRGIGQVMLQNNSYTGLFILLGIFYNSALFGWAVLLGTAASTATAMGLGIDRSQVRAGLFGFNGALTAIALLSFFGPNLLVWGYVALASACATVVMAGLARLLDTWKLPPFTAPFVLTTVLFILAGTRFGHLHATSVLPMAGFPNGVIVGGTVTTSTVAEGVLTGLAQVFFQDNAVTGVFCAVGLLMNSRVACLVALLGSFAGLLVAWGMGAAEPAIRAGMFGFNSVLTAIAVGSGCFVLTAASVVYATFAVAATAIAFAAISAALEPLGVPAMTSPFVLVSWLFLLMSRYVAFVRSAAR